ncbi:hypothetical protein WA1_37315 [Scytonema hofmannii PCC 7110]|uniref:Uncharacterized protein n=1 Tax=Scytonema hofmannii PCC 7110 TaxID=128403 RepID=A0A139X154_9CYAN|nr:hypothetical protein WA1_37315 [Scytonema hofmannii PCC 7110]
MQIDNTVKIGIEQEYYHQSEDMAMLKTPLSLRPLRLCGSFIKIYFYKLKKIVVVLTIFVRYINEAEPLKMHSQAEPGNEIAKLTSYRAA